MSYYALTLCVLTVVINEVAKYINYKNTATLFLKCELLKEHQEQLERVMDSLPNSVLIVDKNLESRTPKSFYSN